VTRARWTLLTASVSLVVVLAEAGARVWLPQPIFEPIPETPSIVPHPARGYTYATNAPRFTNELGVRDRPVAPARTVDVVAAGDSFTVGAGMTQPATWPAQLEMLLNRDRTAGLHVRVLNAGVAGYNVRQIRLFANELSSTLSPRVVLLGLLTSRYWRLRDPYGYFHGVAVRQSDVPRIAVIGRTMVRPAIQTEPWRSVDAFLLRYCRFCAALVELAARASKATNVASSPAANRDDESVPRRLSPLLEEVGQMNDDVRAAGRRFVVLLINEQQPDGRFAAIERQYNDIVISFCGSRDIPVVDPLPALEHTAGQQPIYRQGSDEHWSAAAHAVAAQQAVETVERALR
jgi:hypothetical protein